MVAGAPEAERVRAAPPCAPACGWSTAAHCIHRKDPDAWIEALTTCAEARRPERLCPARWPIVFRNSGGLLGYELALIAVGPAPNFD